MVMQYETPGSRQNAGQHPSTGANLVEHKPSERRRQETVRLPSAAGEWRPEVGYARQLASSLGWFSLGLGLAQVVAPGAISRMVGIPSSKDAITMMRIVGSRELVTGIGLLAQRRPSTWLWLRVAGDAMDLALLGRALQSDHVASNKVFKTMVALAGVTLVDLIGRQQLSQQAGDGWRQGRQFSDSTQTRRAPSVPHEEGIRVEKSITVNRSPFECYQFWRDFENLPRFMTHLKSVQVIDQQRSRWTTKAPAGMSVEWDAEIIDDTPGERISWRSLEGANVPNAGSVRFKPAPGDRGTVVTVEIEYKPPGGAIGAAIAKLFGEEPQQQVEDELRTFKQMMEIGETVRSEAVPTGAGAKQHPAQPPTEQARERVLQ